MDNIFVSSQWDPLDPLDPFFEVLATISVKYVYDITGSWKTFLPPQISKFVVY